MFHRLRLLKFADFRAATESLDGRVITIGYGSGSLNPLQGRWLR